MVVINVLFVLVGDFGELRFLDRENWLIVFWVVVFKCINRNVKVVFFLVNVDWILFLFFLFFDEENVENEENDDGFDFLFVGFFSE